MLWSSANGGKQGSKGALQLKVVKVLYKLFIYSTRLMLIVIHCERYLAKPVDAYFFTSVESLTGEGKSPLEMTIMYSCATFEIS